MKNSEFGRPVVLILQENKQTKKLLSPKLQIASIMEKFKSSEI